jgi:hypothetical protein
MKRRFIGLSLFLGILSIGGSGHTLSHSDSSLRVALNETGRDVSQLFGYESRGFLNLISGNYSPYTPVAISAEPAIAFIDSLSAAQMKEAVFPFYELTPPLWSYFPASMSPVGGVAVKDLTPTQKDRLFDLMRAYLSTSGYMKTRSIMDLEYVLRELQPDVTSRIPENYLVTIYGTPNKDAPWGWSFQGHHVVLKFTVVKDQIAFAPFFFGANPGEITTGPRKGTRPLAAEQDIAFELLNSFSAEQKRQAIFQTSSFVDVVTGSANQVSPLPQAGIGVKNFSAGQKDVLKRLVSAILAAMPESLALKRLNAIKAEDLGAIQFGWAGKTIKTEPHYYRIQGKSFLVEFDSIDGNHVHLVWRDFEGDFGRDLLREHYKTAPHHK